MKNRGNLIWLLLTAFSLSVAGSVSAEEYLLNAKGGLNAGKIRAIERAGGVVTRVFEQIGVAVISSGNPNFADEAASLGTVMPDVVFRRSPDPLAQISGPTIAGLPQPPNTGDDDFFFDLQWGHTSVSAQEAWVSGSTGAGVRVFVLDEGFDLDHPDLAPNFNLALSTSFVPGTTDAAYLLPGVFSHGTHVAGTIGAADNAFGTIGVAPDVDLVPVKVLDELNGGSGAFSWIIAGILYAADNGADVINMSLGAIIPQGLGPDSPIVANLRAAVNSAISYAHQQGATVIVSAGNDQLDLNSPQAASLVNFNAFASQAISISGVGPHGWALDPSTSLTERSYYTNVGPEVDFSGPGGDVDFALAETGSLCNVAGIVQFCYVFDFVFSTGNGGWYWSIGTSMAAPHAAGVAAIIIGENGGSMNPSLVASEMRHRALDLGKPGGDDLHGAGAVNSGY